MDTISTKITNFRIFVTTLYTKINKTIDEDVRVLLAKDDTEILAFIKASVSLLAIKSADELYTVIKDKLHINDLELSKLSADDINRLHRYSEYFYQLSLIL